MPGDGKLKQRVVRWKPPVETVMRAPDRVDRKKVVTVREYAAPPQAMEPRDPRLAEIVARLVCACGADPGAPDWRAVHVVLVVEYRHIWRARRRTARLPPWPGDAAFAPVAGSIEHLGERAAEPPTYELDGVPAEALGADASWLVERMAAADGPLGALLPHRCWRRAALQLALTLAHELAGTSGRGRRSADPARRELRDTLRAFQVEGPGPAIGPTDESRKRDRWVEQHAEEHGRTEVKRDDFRALFAELTNGLLSYRYRFDETEHLIPCDPNKSWQRARELLLACGEKPSDITEKPPRYSHKGKEIRSIGYKNAADAIEDLWRGYRNRRAAAPGGALARAASVLADFERAATKLTPTGE